MTLKNRGRSNKTEGLTGPKSKGGSLAVGTYLQRGSVGGCTQCEAPAQMGSHSSGI